MEVIWDSSRISQAFGNLISNAIDHGSPEEPVVVKVGENSNDEISWTIQNAGEVISSAQLRTIFDPAKRFALRPASERKLSDKINLGLGLYIAREIILAHGGRIGIVRSQFVFALDRLRAVVRLENRTSRQFANLDLVAHGFPRGWIVFYSELRADLLRTVHAARRPSGDEHTAV